MKTPIRLKTLGGISLAVVIVATLYWWLGPDLEVRRALALKDQLANMQTVLDENKALAKRIQSLQDQLA